jgi:hypothetical protein
VPDIKLFPTEVIASLSTGVLMSKFSDMHEAAEHLMGCSIWTHQFADKSLFQAMQAAILLRHPTMPTSAEGVTPENVHLKVRELHAAHGATLAIARGNGAAAKSPLDGFPHGKPVVVL